jgi:hypothetical protein
MTEVAIPQTPTVGALAAAPIVTEIVKDLAAWASEMDAAFKIASVVCNTMFAPAHFRGKPEEAAAAILYGDTLGMPPMVSLKTIYVVHGAPALYAQQMYAIAISKGHEIERVSADEQSVVFRGRRRGTQNWQTVQWTIERARKAKYTSNSKYQENPIGMLTEKCKAEISKLVAPDALAGMSSVEEIELGDFEDLGEIPTPAPTPTQEATPAAAKRTVKRRQAPAATLPDVVHNAPTPEPEAEPVVMCSPEQETHLNAALMAAGHTTSAAKGAAVQEQVGRALGGFQDLTSDEAVSLIEFFNTPAEQPAAPAAGVTDAEWLAGASV